MTLTLITIIYLVGVVVAYVDIKWNMMDYGVSDKWTMYDKRLAMLISILSWGWVIYMLLFSNNDKPAKW